MSKESRCKLDQEFVCGIARDRSLSREEAALLLEDVLDTLVEVGNGTSDEMLTLACHKLFLFRDGYFNREEWRRGG